MYTQNNKKQRIFFDAMCCLYQLADSSQVLLEMSFVEIPSVLSVLDYTSSEILVLAFISVRLSE